MLHYLVDDCSVGLYNAPSCVDKCEDRCGRGNPCNLFLEHVSAIHVGKEHFVQMVRCIRCVLIYMCVCVIVCACTCVAMCINFVCTCVWRGGLYIVTGLEHCMDWCTAVHWVSWHIRPYWVR